jgi:hypothetical protein
VYRTDWEQLSLSATISRTYDPEVAERLAERKAAESRRAWGPPPGASRIPEVDDEDRRPVHSEHSVLIAPGGRYRLESSHGMLEVCDGEHYWDVSGGVAHRGPRPRRGSTFHGLLTPQWLIACYELQITGTEVAGDRAAIAVTGTPRTASARRPRYYHFLDRVEVLVDAETGILLRSRQVFEGRSREFADLRDVVMNPAEAGMSGMFAPPPGVPVEDEEETFADYEPPSGVGWQVAGAAAGAAANALGFAIKHAPRRKSAWPADDEGPDMPGDTVLAPEDWEQRQPPDDRTINLLHRTGLHAPALTADVHEWIDVLPSIQAVKEFQEKMPAFLDGIFGPDAVWDALGERAARDGRRHRVARLAVQNPGQYRLDYLSGDWNKRYTAIACDGEHTTKLFTDRVATGPVRRLDAKFATMLDPAWLLTGWRLAVVGSARVAGRNGVRIRAVASPAAGNLSTRADVVVDAELGVLLRNTTYMNDQPATRTELRDLSPLDDKTSFRIVPGPGVRSVTESGSPLADLNLPRPAEAATTAAALAAAGAVAVTGWLDKHRARRDRR